MHRRLGIGMHMSGTYVYILSGSLATRNKREVCKFILFCFFETTIEDAITYRRSKRWFTLGRMIEVVLNDRYAQVMD